MTGKLIVNCNIFGNSQLRGTGAGVGSVDGICQGIQRFFTARSLASSDIVLTWDVNTKRGDQRRTQACGSQYCTAQQTLLRQTTGDKTIEISCDEFPFASTEEGGNYYQTLPVNPTSPQLTCVPAWQNTLQGNCNSKSQSRPACSLNSWIYMYEGTSLNLRNI